VENVMALLDNAPQGDHGIVTGELSGPAPLVRKITCPHCWQIFPPEDVLWVAEHEDLMHDHLLPEEPLRFLPTRFTADCLALDPRGMVCHSMACPQCHLSIPRVLLENEVTFYSLIGSVGSGKSNFLAAMTWQLRQQLARQFRIIFSDGDKESNWVVNRYEETLFLPDDPDRLTLLEKTRTQGDLYRSVRLKGQQTQLPKPFLFAVHPAADHPLAAHRRRSGTILCMYDNAGEHFGVGQDSALTPVTRHLSHARVLMYLFDPTQDPRFRDRCKGVSSDPQITEPLQTVRQETVLAEATQRLRKHRGLSAYQRYDRPLLVLVAKSDIWAPLLDADTLSEPILLPPHGHGQMAAVDIPRIQDVSRQVRALLLQIAPEIVTTAEDFSAEVTYIPVSALGHSPQHHPEQPGLVIRPRDIRPRWVTVPVLYALAQWHGGLIPAKKMEPQMNTDEHR
jgi:hypothetical protein